MKPIVFDLETGSADDRYDDPPNFVRVCGARRGDDYFSTTDARSFARMIGSAPAVIGHNILSFDLPVLAGANPGSVDMLAMTRAGRVWDTMVAESLLDPPEADDRSGAVERAMKRYALDATCIRHELKGKVGALVVMAGKHGGYTQIPVDDPEYLAYLRGDVDATAVLARLQLPHRTPYLMREMRVHALGSVMTQAGVELDVNLATERDNTIRKHKAELTATLIDRYGLVTTKADGKPATSPHTTASGKASIVAAFESLGVPPHELPRTPKGEPSFGGEGMHALGERHGGAVAELCEVIADLAGQRTVYGTALQHLRSNGRVHPQNRPYQASGRWSVVRPGMTVFGKRGGRVVEREVFRASEGHVLVAFDLAQIDMRAIAAHCQDPAYLAILSDPARDLHSEIAARLWGGPVTANPMREKAKACGHGWNYGLGVEGLSVNAGIPLADAERFNLTMTSMFPLLVSWRERVRLMAKLGPLDNGFGRWMRCDPRRAYTQGPALMGQGTARDLILECGLRLPDDIARMLRVLVHDEFVAEVPVADCVEVAHEIRTACTFDWAPPGATIPVPIRADISGFSKTWSGCYDH